MLPLKSLDGQYVLSLDSLDINLLSQYIQRPHNKLKMLWTRPDLDGEASYHQVKLMHKDLQTEDKVFDDYETYLCHICNVNVPQTYHDEHTKSKKHQTHKKLATKFLENIAKEMNTNFNNFKKNNQHDSFYCETCSKVVSLKHKSQHEKSDYHLQSIENDKQIDSVLKMYDGNKTVSEHDQFSDTNRLSVARLFQSGNIKNITCEIKDHFFGYEPKQEEFVSKVRFESVLDTKADIMYLIKQVVEECNSKFVMPIMQNNYVTIVTPNGSKEQISISSYFGYKQNLYSFSCQICEYIINDADIIQHLATELHLQNILRPVNNNFAREVIIPDEHFIESMSHCLLCNELVYNELLHVTEKHPHLNKNIPQTKKRKRIRRRKQKEEGSEENNPNTEPKNATNTKTTKKTFCDVCSVYIDTHNFLAHTKAGKHHENLKKNTPSVSDAKNNSTGYKVPPFHLMSCEVCDVYVPIGGMEVHIKGKPHQNKLATK